MTSQLAQVTPVDRQPLAYTTGPVNAVRVWNPTAYNVRVILGGQLYDIIPAGKDAIYNVANLSGYAGWVLLIPATPVDGSQLNGQIVVTTYGAADALPSGTISQQSEARYQPNMANPDPILDSLRGALSFNVRMFGARGDGVSDDRAAIQACLDACRVCGGGEVYLPAATYLLGTAKHPLVTTQNVCLVVGAHTTMRGAGPHATTLKLVASAPNQTQVIVNYNEQTGGDTAMTFCDFSLDGNASGQPGTTDANFGLGVTYAENISYLRIHAHDFYGTTQGGNGPNGTLGESWGISANNSTNVSIVDCQYYGASGNTNTASGFSINTCTNVMIANCVAHNTYHSHGFTHWTCANVSYVNCIAYLCGGTGAIAGFNSEVSNTVSYSGCISGGVSANGSTYPYGTAQTGLSNYSYGFRIMSGTYHTYTGCHSYGNPFGLYLDSGSGAVSQVFLHGCVFVGGAQYGVFANAGYTVSTVSLPSSNLFTNFTNGQFSLNGVAGSLLNFVTPPTIPPSTAVVTNSYPFAVLVDVVGGTISGRKVNGTTYVDNPFIVPRGGTVEIDYTAAPTSWSWMGI